MFCYTSLRRPLAQAALAASAVFYSALAHSACSKTIYLTFDTGSQSQAQLIADTLKKHSVKATFFLANEKTVNGDHSLDESWKPYWQSLAAQGHAFGTHTFDHTYLKPSTGALLTVKPQFGKDAGKLQQWTSAQYCAHLKKVDERFQSFTGQPLHPLWRAPGGHVSERGLAVAQQCGYQHVGWAPAGFLGDELSSETHPNDALLKKALAQLKDGDIAMAHLGIWSRKKPWAPAVLEPLIVGLKAQGACFATVAEHPQYGNKKPLQTTLKF
jgi:peptidoglycan/xylan/chitin deacetylase (PgdA/CDA1 family)